MDLIDRLKHLSRRISTIKDSITTEEATKMSLVVPFFQTLGYDVFNHEEFLPEFTADVGIKKGEKVDYAIMIDGKPSILIECKWCGEILNRHDSQLFRYFGTTTAKFAILTNGIIYKFFTDLDEANKMDLTPFLEIDLENIKENVLPEIKKFQKDKFDPSTLVNSASELKYSKAIKDFFEDQLNEPSDDFVKFFLSRVYEGVKTQSVIEKFNPIVKRALNEFINEKMNDKIKTALSNAVPSDVPQPDEKNEEDESSQESKLTTTQTEIEAFYLVKSILVGTIDLDRLSYRDTENYFAIIVDNKVTWWICRIKLDGNKKHITLQNDDKTQEKVLIKDINDIYFHKQRLIDCAMRFI